MKLSIVLVITFVSLLCVAANGHRPADIARPDGTCSPGTSPICGELPISTRFDAKIDLNDEIISGQSYTLILPTKGAYFIARDDGTFATSATQESGQEVFGFKKAGTNRWSLRTSSGKYVCFDKGHKQFETRGGVGDWEKFEFHPTGTQNTYNIYIPHEDSYANFEGPTVTLAQSSSQASAVVIEKALIDTSRPPAAETKPVSKAEEVKEATLESGTYTLKTPDGGYFRANDDETFTQNNPFRHDESLFVLTKAGAKSWALRTSFGKYVGYDELHMFVNRDSVGNWERFEFHPTGAVNTYHMYSPHHDVYFVFGDNILSTTIYKSLATPLVMALSKNQAPRLLKFKPEQRVGPTTANYPIPIDLGTVASFAVLVSVFFIIIRALIAAVDFTLAQLWRGIRKLWGYGNRTLKRKSPTPKPARIAPLESGKTFSLQLPSGAFFSAASDGTFNATAPHCSECERFVFSKVGASRWSLKTTHGKFLCFDAGKKQFETREKVGDWERFEFQLTGAVNTYHMYSPHHDIYVDFTDGTSVREVFDKKDATPLVISPTIIDEQKTL